MAAREPQTASHSTSTQILQQQDNQFVHPWESMHALGNNERTIVTQASGIYVYDSDGNKMIDGPAGMWCVNVGYGRHEIAEAMAKQAIEMPYSSPFSMGAQPSGVLAEKLAALAPGDLNHVFFTTGGSTAVDSALRFLGFYNNFLGRPEKKHIISREDAYHGSTYLSASVSGKSRDKDYVDLEQGFIHLLSSPNPFRRPAGMTPEEFRDAGVKELEDKILEIGPDRVAAFIAEPIMASGGVVIPPAGYHKACLEVCRRHDVLYISDEVVTAFGRLGHMFASEPVFDIVPDMITCAKGLTSGYVPLGALLISDRLLEELRGDEDHQAVFPGGYTYSGHPVSCAAALENIDIIERENLLENAREVAPYFLEQLATLEDLPLVAEVRGVGLMAGVECAIPGKESLKLDYEVGNRIDAHCQRLGLLVRPIYHMCVLSPPLIITPTQIDDLVAILRKGIELATEDLRREGIWE
jgi:adenosylmethionine-8-amino-7-oxononanoate aminotransferase